MLIRRVTPAIPWKFRFLRDYLRGNVSRGGPFCAFICLTSRCNLRCAGCRFHAPDMEQDPVEELEHRDMPLDFFLRLLGELKQMGTRKMILSGEGEPLLHPCVTEMLKAASRNFPYTALLTNGTLLTDSMVSSLLQSGLKEIRISLWATNPREYALQYPGTQGEFFYRVIAGIRALTTRKQQLGYKDPAVVLHRPISREHFRSMPDSVELAASSGCNGITFSPLKPRIHGETALLPSEEEQTEILRLLEQANLRAHQLKLAHNISQVITRYQVGPAVWERYSCYIGWSDLRIASSGKTTFCHPCQRNLGNAREEPLTTLWNGPAARRFRQLTRTREGLDRIRRHDCLCAYCCHLPGNHRIHGYLGWLPDGHAAWLEEDLS
jgi:MoaA/NifB/PqqE/SkfB family radical SAM enzyme